MASFTRRALQQTLLTLLETMSLDKITVKGIVDTCGISRNTFYYHYEDIPSLLADTLETEFAKTAQSGDPLYRLLTLVAEHRRVFAHIDGSQSRELFRKRLRQAMEASLRDELAQRSPSLSPAALDTLAIFFTGGYGALFIRWLEQGAQEPPAEFLTRLNAVLPLVEPLPSKLMVSVPGLERIHRTEYPTPLLPLPVFKLLLL